MSDNSFQDGANVTIGGGGIPSGLEGLTDTSHETAAVGANGVPSGLEELTDTSKDEATVAQAGDPSDAPDGGSSHEVETIAPGSDFGPDSMALADAQDHLDNISQDEFNPSPENFDTHDDWVDHTDYTLDSHGDAFGPGD